MVEHFKGRCVFTPSFFILDFWRIDIMKKWSNLAKIVYARTYARPTEGGKVETWEQTVDRVIEGNIGKYRGTDKLGENEEERVKYYMLNRKAMPAGRGLWFSGTEAQAKLGGIGLNSCFFLTADDYHNFCIAQDMLMLGGGVGMSVEHRFVSKLPRVKRDVKVTEKDTKDADFIVPDSREGWVELTRRLLKAFFDTGKGFTYSTILVRGAGEPIAGFGGTASGKVPLVKFISKLSSILKAREGKTIRPIDALDIICSIGEMVVAGNVRRSALLVQGDAWDKEFLKAKRWSLGNIPTQRAMANLSIVCDDIKDVHPAFWETYKDGEPFGIINRTNMRKFGRMGELKKDTALGTNPCLTGDTMVGTIYGDRTIQELAEAGDDVPVYCLDDKGKLIIRMMRNPRITGFNERVYNLVLDDGSVIRATANHKFRLKDGTYVRLDSLKTGDSLMVLSKYKASIKDIFKGANSNSQDYTWMNTGSGGPTVEHRLVAEFYTGPIPEGSIVHHKDRDASNNHIDNLQVMTREAHYDLHREDMMEDKNHMRRAKTEWSKEKWDDYRMKHSKNSTGSSNSNANDVTNEALLEEGLKLTQRLGRRFSTDEWEAHAKANNLPQRFSSWRKSSLGKVVVFSKGCALKAGLEAFNEADPRTVRVYQKCIEAGLNAEIVGTSVAVIKECEECTKEFVVTYQNRENCFCRPCALVVSNTNSEHIKKRSAGKLRVNTAKQDVIRVSQAKVYSDLKFQLGRDPQKLEWVSACKSADVSFEIARVSSPFRTYSALKEAASMYNHKVVSVEFDKYEDVYNGTVDDVHNFFCGGLKAETEAGKAKWLYLNNLQCGEVPLDGHESCNLTEIFLPNLENEAEFLEAASLMYRWSKRVSCEDYHLPKTDAVVKTNRRLGISVTGCLQSDLFDPDILDRVYKSIKAEDTVYSKQLGVPKSIKLTTVKPSGTVSLLGDVTSGIHPAYSRFYIRRIRFGSSDPLIPLLQEAGHKVEPVVKFDGTLDHGTQVVEFPCKAPDNTPIADENWDTWKQLDVLKTAQKSWSDNAVSVTVYYEKDNLDAIKQWLIENLSSLKTISFLCHSDHGFIQAPYEKITEDQYIKMTEKVTDIDVASVGIAEDVELDECEGGVCPIK